jgi:hypothetical protein
VNTSFLQGDDPEADLLGKATPAAPTAPAAEAASQASRAQPAAVASAPPAKPRGRTAASGRPAPPPPRPEKRWQRVNVYLEPRTQGHWLNRTRGRLLEQDRGDIGVTEIVRLALDRLSDQLNVSELVAEYDRRYGAQEEA